MRAGRDTGHLEPAEDTVVPLRLAVYLDVLSEAAMN